MQCAARSSGRVMLNEPRNDFASPVRELATTTASRISSPAQTIQTAPAKIRNAYRFRNDLRGDRVAKLAAVLLILTPSRSVPGSVRRRSCLPRPNASTQGQVPRVRHAVYEILKCGGRPYPVPRYPHTTSDRRDRPGI